MGGIGSGNPGKPRGPRDEKTRKAISAAMMGRKHTDAAKRKMRRSQRKRRAAEKELKKD